MNVRKKPKVQWRMATLDIQDTGRGQTNKNTIQHRNLKRWATRTSPKNGGMNSGAQEGYVVPVSYKTPTVLRVTHIVKSGKNLLSVMKEKIHQRKRGKINCHLRYGYYVAVN
jgi:hypothetical protein